jgi:hypothetical protein
MIQRLERLIEVIKLWPESRQDDAAAVLEVMAGQDGGAKYVLSAAERQAVEASRAQVRNGEFARDDEVAAILLKHGL